MLAFLKRHPKLNYALWLMAGFLGLCLPELLDLSWGSGLGTAVWMLSFMHLTGEFRTKRKLILTGTVFCAGYLLKYAGASGIAWLYWVLFIGMGLFQYGVFLFYGWIVNKWNRFVMTLLFPILWMLLYLLVTLLRFPTLARVDMMFSDMNVLFQAESTLGSFDFSGALLWILSMFHYAIRNRHYGAATLGTVLYCALLLIGIVWLQPNVVCDESVRIAYTTGPYVGDYLNYEALPVETFIESMQRSAKAAAEQNAEILVFSEEAFELKDTEEAAFTELCCEAAKENGIHMLVGLDVEDTDGSSDGMGQNKIVWIQPDGTVLDTYLKTMLVPLIENGYEAGDGSIPIHTIEVGDRSIKVAFLICYDSNFARYVSKIDADTEILFLPSWDWPAVTKLHTKLCRAIAAENRINVIKPTYDGLSIAVDVDGKIIYASSTDDTGYENLQVVDLPLRGSDGSAYVLPEKSDAMRSIIAAEIMSLFVCVIIFYGSLFENRDRTKRNRIFTLLVFTTGVALVSDVLSWLVDGSTRLLSVAYVTSVLTLVLTFILTGQFVAYLTAYIRERKQVSSRFLRGYMVFAVIAMVLTIVGSVNGMLFTIEDGVYADGPYYWLYVLANVVSMICCLMITVVHRKELTAHDNAAAYLYATYPGAAALVNMAIPEFSYAYPACTLSLVTLFVMIQSERVVKLTREGEISSHYARHDDLTGLLNRRAYDEKLDKVQNSSEQVGVIFADMNLLKYTNDHFGHAAGDQLIIRFSEMLTTFFRKEEVFRVSGDEFTIILPGIKREIFEQRAEKLENVLGEDDPALACIGVEYGDGGDVYELLKSAEEIMYRKKERFHEAHPEMNLH